MTGIGAGEGINNEQVARPTCRLQSTSPEPHETSAPGISAGLRSQFDRSQVISIITRYMPTRGNHAALVQLALEPKRPDQLGPHPLAPTATLHPLVHVPMPPTASPLPLPPPTGSGTPTPCGSAVRSMVPLYLLPWCSTSTSTRPLFSSAVSVTTCGSSGAPSSTPPAPPSTGS